MVISRRPNRRASMENAPGPRKPIAADITTTKRVAKPELSKFGVGTGTHEIAIPALPRPTVLITTGVRNPISSETPLPTASKLTTLVPNV